MSLQGRRRTQRFRKQNHPRNYQSGYKDIAGGPCKWPLSLQIHAYFCNFKAPFEFLRRALNI